MIELTIDGKKIKAEQEKTILEVTLENGFDVPHLCWHRDLKPYGACRVCLVEIARQEGGERKLVASCTHPVENNLIVYTNSERVLRIRKIIVGLLIARAPDSEIMKDLGKKYGITSESHDEIAIYLYNRITRNNPGNCILCGLCVRVCSEITGREAIGFICRGMERKVQTPFNKISEVCIGCGACAYVCPTHAIEIEESD